MSAGMKRAVAAILATFGALCVAGGCAPPDSFDAPIEDVGDNPFDCSADDSLHLEPIEDFESGIAPGFYTNNDRSEGSVAVPPPSSSPLSDTIVGGRCGTSQQALHLTGSGFSDWGMVWGRNFDDGPVDHSDWDGISFWARRGAVSGASLFFSVTDINTDPVGGVCQGEPEMLRDKCDAYGVGVGLEEKWRFFQIPFSSLRQRGFGVTTERFADESIVGIGWAAGPGEWDVWVDDVSLYRVSAGGGGASGE